MKRKYLPSNSIKDLRDFYGISQEDFARYLSIGRSTLAMVETNKQEMPLGAVLKYAPMLVLAFGKGGLTDQPLPAPALSAAEKEKLLDKAVDCDLQAERCRRKLAAMQKAYATASHALAMVAHVLPTLSEDEEAKTERLILQIMESDAKKSLAENGAGPQAMLQWKLDNFIAGAKSARKMAGSNGGICYKQSC